jgi:hypothetical protein
MVSVVVRRRVAWFSCATALLTVYGACRRQPPDATPPAETVSRTEFTERIENFFEYEPLRPGKRSAFLIHITDLSDGAPVEKADVALTIRPEGAGRGLETKAKIGRVTGIYVADVTVPSHGSYTIEFRVKNAKVDERMVLEGFATEGQP